MELPTGGGGTAASLPGTNREAFGFDGFARVLPAADPGGWAISGGRGCGLPGGARAWPGGHLPGHWRVSWILPVAMKGTTRDPVGKWVREGYEGCRTLSATARPYR